MISYSFIIPNKNLTDLLQRCVDSIPHREDIEIIIIDDCSNPDIIDFNNYPGSNRNNVKIIYLHEPQGAGGARNKGLEIAQGKWIVFLDSDDYFTNEISTCLDKYKDRDEDILYFLPTSADSDNGILANRHLPKIKMINSVKNNIAELERVLKYSFTEPWCKFIKRDLITRNNIKFEESMVANDYRFSIFTAFFAKSIYFAPIQIYCVTVRKGSLCNNLFDSPDKIISRLQVCYGIQNFSETHNINIIPFDFFIELCIRHWVRSRDYTLCALKIFLVKKGKSTYSQIFKSLYHTVKYRLWCRIKGHYPIH